VLSRRATTTLSLVNVRTERGARRATRVVSRLAENFSIETSNGAGHMTDCAILFFPLF